MYGPNPHCTPVFNECVPVTYDTPRQHMLSRIGAVGGVLRPIQYLYGVHGAVAYKFP